MFDLLSAFSPSLSSLRTSHIVFILFVVFAQSSEISGGSTRGLPRSERAREGERVRGEKEKEREREREREIKWERIRFSRDSNNMKVRQLAASLLSSSSCLIS